MFAKFGRKFFVFVFLNANAKLQPRGAVSREISFWTDKAWAGFASGSLMASLVAAMLER